MQNTIPKRKLPKRVKAVSLAQHDLLVSALTDRAEFAEGRVAPEWDKMLVEQPPFFTRGGR